MNNKGYIYLRNHFSYEIDNLYFLGSTINLLEKDCEFASNELNRGSFIFVLEVDLSKTKIIERLLKSKFKEYNKIDNAGTDFYDTKIIDLIEPYLQELKLNYIILSQDEIKKLTNINKILYYIYILKLEKDKYYVGKTNNPEFNLNCYSNDLKWTSLYKPIEILEIIPNCDDENEYTIKYMNKYGINNVRGGSFNSVKLDEMTTKALENICNSIES